jgi:hypothetical protein
VHSEDRSTGEESNPIYRHLIDYRLVEEIMSGVEAMADPRLQAERARISSTYQRIKARCVGTSVSMEQREESGPYYDWTQLSPKDLVALSQEAFGDICEFGQLTMAFYATLRSYRPLTAEEREQGKKLSTLLVGLHQFIPTSGNAKGTENRKEDAAAL